MCGTAISLMVSKKKTTVREVCKEAGVEGKFTNHSLRATCASRMFQKNIPEQVIKEFTGHKSDCVRLYKGTSNQIRETASKTMSSDSIDSDKVVKKEVVKSSKKVKKDSQCKKEVLSYSQMILNVEKTKMELRKKKFPKSRLKLKRTKQSQRVKIDLNFNVCNKRKEIKFNKCKQMYFCKLSDTC